MAQQNDDTEHLRQEIIRSMMLDGMTREDAEKEESRRFQRAVAKLFRA